MKTHKKILITIALALGLAGVAFAVCRTNGAIPDVDIHTHDAGDIEYANEEAVFGCTNIPYEWDECRTDPACPWGKVADDVDILWEATAGSFKDNDNEGSSVIWIAPGSAGDVTLTATADDDARYSNDTAKDDSVTIEVVECDDSVNYDVGERCETCEWKEADQFFPYCGTPKYVEVEFYEFVGCGFPSVQTIILIQTTPTVWHVTLNGGVFCTWRVYDDVYYPDYNSTLLLEGVGSCPAFYDGDMPVCYDGKDPIIGEFTNVNNCEGGCPCACGHSGTAKVFWNQYIGHTEYIEQYPLWQQSVEYEHVEFPYVSDMVRHSSKLYICIESHTSSPSNEPPNATYWVELPS